MSNKVSMEFDKRKAVSFSLVVLTLLLLGNIYFLYDTNKKISQYEEDTDRFERFENNIDSDVKDSLRTNQDQDERIEELESKVRELNRSVQRLQLNHQE